MRLLVTRPNILYLTHRVPYPPNRGDRIRAYHTLRFLAEQANVHLACLTEEPLTDETRSKLNELCARVEVVPLGAHRWLHGVWSLATGRLPRKLERLFQTFRFSAVSDIISQTAEEPTPVVH